MSERKLLDDDEVAQVLRSIKHLHPKDLLPMACAILDEWLKLLNPKQTNRECATVIKSARKFLGAVDFAAGRFEANNSNETTRDA